MGIETTGPLTIPQELPLLRALSWFDADYRNLDPIDMLRRYETGWRHRTVFGEPLGDELTFIRNLVARFGSVLRA